MNKNYNKYFNKNVNEKQEPEIQVVLEEDCDGGVCEFESQEKEDTKIVNKAFGMLVREVGNCEYLNLRESPSLDAKVLTVIKRGVTLTLLEPINDDGEWIKVRVHSTGVEGFIMRDYTI